MTPRDEASKAQVRAADPSGSTWLSANAGSGKTRVLTDRVARLLLQDVDPQKILCLTYTKAAASEMQNRLFSRLGAWAMQEDTALHETLSELGVETVPDLARARTLFASAIETPGGLKIQTIHSFCSGLLRRFPLEAGVNPQFQEMDERSGELLRARILEDMATGTEAEALRDLVGHLSSDQLSELTQEIARRRVALAEGARWEDTAARFGIDAELTEDRILRSVFLGGELDLLSQIIAPMLEKGGQDTKHAQVLSRIETTDIAALEALDKLFVVQASGKSKRGKFPTKPTREHLLDILDDLDELIDRVHGAREPLRSLRAARRTQALHDFAAPFLRHYAEAKRDRGWLDFDDLTLKARDLLSDPATAAWVLFRLDGGISHILVDEAQDTSPEQWDIIRKLSEEMTSGAGGRPDTHRTVFVVGDKKQSIYSFQGADPDAFDVMEAEFAARFNGIGEDLNRRTLDFSFRSSDAILRLVDCTFEGMEDAGFVRAHRHRAFHADKPGRVELWPEIDSVTVTDERKWFEPLDHVPETHHTIKLAQKIADRIAEMLQRPDSIPIQAVGGNWTRRPVRAGDIMVLVQRRSELFHQIIRACKKRALPVAGADRLRVGAELAVRDLLALLSVLATPEDSLSLATVLRSPLFGWSEQELFTLAHGRRETHLWQTLRERRDAHSTTWAVLSDLRDRIDFLRPFELLERILTRHEGRARLLARLGQEAEDGIDAILDQALRYEEEEVPSLTGFLSWATADDLQIKRQVDSSSDLIRVMTVHGAKGLESPIVILPDCGKRKVEIRDQLLPDMERVVWKMPAPMPEALTCLQDALKQRDMRERLRLLYVAMTRAESWLIVAAAGDLSGDDSSDWHQIVRKGMERVGAFLAEMPTGPDGLLYEFGNWALPDAPEQEPSGPAEDAALEPLFREPPPERPARETLLSPSDLGGAKALPGDVGLPEPVALARGTYIHILLERLPQFVEMDWPEIIARMPVPTELSAPLAAEAAEDACRVLQQADTRWVFAPGGFSEVSLTAPIGERTLLGTIDRLLIAEDRVIAVDFKTNMVVPETPEQCPEGLLRQMGAYAAALRQIYPGRRVETGILWTARGVYMSLPHKLVSDALARSPHLDAAGAAP